jgi:short-subunit dehydrogenase
MNVTSITGRFGLPFMSPYDATKFAVEGMSESLRYEQEGFGIRIKLVEPGGVKTNFAHEWVSHPVYEPSVSRLMAKMTARASRAEGPEAVARVLFNQSRPISVQCERRSAFAAAEPCSA